MTYSAYVAKPPAKFVLNAEIMQTDIAEYRLMNFDYVSTFIAI